MDATSTQSQDTVGAQDDGAAYRSMLKNALKARMEKNRRFSLRAFARQIEIHPAQLSRVLNGKANISPSVAAAVARKVFDRRAQRDLFVSLVELAVARREGSREKLLQSVQRLTAISEEIVVDTSVSNPFENWKSLAMLEMTELKSFRPTMKWMADYLGVQQADVERMLKTLMDAGLIVETKNPAGEKTYQKRKARVATRGGTPNLALRGITRQFLALGMEALDVQPIDSRYFRTRSIAIREQDFAKLRDAANDFLSEVSAITYRPHETDGMADRVVQVQLQIFDLKSPGSGVTSKG